MALATPIPGARITQPFGVPASSVISLEPAMYASTRRAYWQPFTGLAFKPHFHAALDLGAELGTPILASETGKVVFAGTRQNGGGLCVQVEIRPNVRYEHAHCSSILVRTGTRVGRGQVIARVGSTGVATGNHSHFTVSIREVDQYGAARTFLWNPALFLTGGIMANDPRIKPLVAEVIRYMRVNGAGINFRSKPDLSSGDFIFATSSLTPAPGIYRLGKRIATLDAKMRFRQWYDNAYGTWAVVWLGGGYRYVKKELVHFV